MITAGIDSGAENLKVVIMRDGEIVSYSIMPLGRESVASIAERGLEEAREKGKISVSEIESVVTTGIGRDYISNNHNQASESSCVARGTSYLVSSADTVVDMGADKCLIVKCRNGRPLKTVRNDRCAAGSGRFLNIAAKPLGLDVGEMGRLSLQSRETIEINNTCAVFAESEIISLIHLKHRPEDIAKAVFRGLAFRVHTMLSKVAFGRDLVMIGGIAKNIGMVKALEEQAGCSIVVPEEPMIVGAVGAALIGAKERKVPPMV